MTNSMTDLSLFYQDVLSYKQYVAMAYGVGWVLFLSLSAWIVRSWNRERRALSQSDGEDRQADVH